MTVKAVLAGGHAYDVAPDRPILLTRGDDVTLERLSPAEAELLITELRAGILGARQIERRGPVQARMPLAEGDQ